jgi:predicted double-glycine peptidase
VTSRLALGLLCALLLLPQAARAQAVYESFYADANVLVPIQTFRDRQYARVVRQEYDFSCGSAALATLLTFHYDMPRTERDVFTAMWEAGEQDKIRARGFSLLDMKRYLEAAGLRADGYAMPLEKVEEIGVPGIALIDQDGYKHFVVVKGVLGDRVLVGDPAGGLVARDRRAFERSWDGTIFFLRSLIAQGQSAWNAEADWAAQPQGRPFDRLPLADLADETLLNTRLPTSGFGLGPAAGF